MKKENLKRIRVRSSFVRSESTRASYDIVLIVCEGQKTEPLYFNGLVAHFMLNPINFSILFSELGSDPVSVVNFAIEHFKKSKNEGLVYDKIFCVFDREYPNYQDAMKKIEAFHKKGMPIFAIPSAPCFEFWLLLHFEESTKPYEQAGKKSPAEQVISKLKKYLPAYTKVSESLFEDTQEYLSLAIRRAKRIEKLQAQTGSSNPLTRIHELVEYLMSIKK